MLRQQNPSDVDVAITPEELEGLDEASIQALYNQRVAEERARNAREVCSLFKIQLVRFVLFKITGFGSLFLRPSVFEVRFGVYLIDLSLPPCMVVAGSP